MAMQRNWFSYRWLWLGSAIIAAGITCALGQNPPKNNQQPAKTPATTQTPAPACSVADGFTLAAVGDLIFSEPLSGLQDAPFQAVLTRLHNADATFGNLENTLIDLRSFQGHPQAEYGGAHLLGSPAVAKDLRNMGFNVVSRANNHATDWGVEGMFATDKAADEAGLVHAGTGYNRSEARAAHYLQTSKGRIALVSMTTSAPVLSMSSDPQGRAPGRPGVSALRIKGFMVVSPEMMQSLRKIHEALPPAMLQDEVVEKSVLSPEGQNWEKPGELSLSVPLFTEMDFRVGDKPVRFTFEMNESDLHEILNGVRQGKQNSDFLIATIHAHEPDNWSDAKSARCKNLSPAFWESNSAPMSCPAGAAAGSALAVNDSLHDSTPAAPPTRFAVTGECASRSLRREAYPPGPPASTSRPRPALLYPVPVDAGAVRYAGCRLRLL